MKLITLNTHSLIEPDYEKKLRIFAELVKKEKPDIIALQEVNQTMASSPVKEPEQTGFVSCPDCAGPVREDNHGLNLARLLKEEGLDYCWTWAPAKVGYDIYEEGLAVFSRRPAEAAEQFYISESRSFSNWKTRKTVGIRVGGQWFYTVHMGWWGDEEEPFDRQWDRVRDHLETRRNGGETVWIMGDFNSPSDRAQEGYDYVKDSGWLDTYELAGEKDQGITVGHVIDGWREEGKQQTGMRIDYIWCSRKASVQSSKVICNDTNYPVVSDHYGVMITTES